MSNTNLSALHILPTIFFLLEVSPAFTTNFAALPEGPQIHAKSLKCHITRHGPGFLEMVPDGLDNTAWGHGAEPTRAVNLEQWEKGDGGKLL